MVVVRYSYAYSNQSMSIQLQPLSDRVVLLNEQSLLYFFLIWSAIFKFFFQQKKNDRVRFEPTTSSTLTIRPLGIPYSMIFKKNTAPLSEDSYIILY